MIKLLPGGTWWNMVEHGGTAWNLAVLKRVETSRNGWVVRWKNSTGARWSWSCCDRCKRTTRRYERHKWGISDEGNMQLDVKFKQNQAESNRFAVFWLMVELWAIMKTFWVSRWRNCGDCLGHFMPDAWNMDLRLPTFGWHCRSYCFFMPRSAATRSLAKCTQGRHPDDIDNIDMYDMCECGCRLMCIYIYIYISFFMSLHDIPWFMIYLVYPVMNTWRPKIMAWPPWPHGGLRWGNTSFGFGANWVLRSKQPQAGDENCLDFRICFFPVLVTGAVLGAVLGAVFVDFRFPLRE